MRGLRNFKVVLGALLALVLVGTAGFHFIEGWSWLDSLYMVVITLTTIGYGEVHPLSHTGKIFNIGFIVAGVVLATMAIGSLTQYLLEFELTKVLGRRRMGREIARLSNHYILCGAGRVGRRAARELARKPVAFVVVEREESRLANLDPEWLVIQGDATQEKVLREARIEQAVGLVAATTTDATNIYIVLTARSLNPKLRIIARASEEDAEKHLLTAGADSVVSPYSFAGHRIAQSFLRPNVLDFLDVATTREGKVEMSIEEIYIGKNSPFAEKTVGNSLIHREFGIIVLAIKHPQGQTVFNPTANVVIQPGDHLIVMGAPEDMTRLEAIASNHTQRS